MESLFSIIGVTFSTTTLLCWLLTSNWLLNPAVTFIVFVGGVLLIGSWGMAAIETGDEG
jgi:hypothetical protein